MGLLEKKYMIFSNIQYFETNEILSFGNVVIKRVTNLKYLGIIVDEMITWKDHVRALTIKVSPGTGILNRLKHFIPHKALKTLYYTVVSSYLEHGCALLSNLFSYNTRKIQLQNWAVKTLFSYKYSTSDSSQLAKVLKCF